MNKDWMAVFEALRAVYADGAYSNISVNEAVAHHKSVRESFVRTFTKGVIRSSIRLDYIIDSLAKKGIKSIKLRQLIILRMGIFAINELDSVPDHAAVNEAVSLAKVVSKGSDRFINGMLRAYLRAKDEFSPDKMEPHIRYSFSEEVYSLLVEQYGGEAHRIMDALNAPAEVYLRTNTLQTSRYELISGLEKLGISCRVSDENSEAICAAGSGIVSNDLYRRGFYTVQSLSSMIALKSLSPEPGSTVLDMCCAPGGKTGYMAELMENNGSITACDIYPHRLAVTHSAMERIGIGICTLKECNAAVFDPSFEAAFDYVLADVPCSGLGVIASKPEIRLKTDPSKYGELINLQEKILENGISYLKKGGRLEYSTCTLNKQENELLVKHVLSKKGSSAGIVEMRTIMPYNGKVGFFYCIVEKYTS